MDKLAKKYVDHVLILKISDHLHGLCHHLQQPGAQTPHGLQVLICLQLKKIHPLSVHKG